jgi:protein-disulfide isomerase
MEEEGLSKRERQKLNKEKTSGEVNKNSTLNKLMVVGGLLALAAGAFWFIYRGGSPAPSVDTTTPSSPSEVTAQDHTKGPQNALITLIEYGDYQCPGCAAYNPLISQIADEFKNDLRLVHRSFPLRSIHRNAQIAAQAAEAAGDQGMFWEMNDILYSRQDDWKNTRDPRSQFKEYASELTLNVEQFENYMNSDAAKSKVDADYNSGLAAGIDSTPTFFINGDKIQNNPQGLEPFRQLILQKFAEVMPPGRGEEATDSGDSTPEGEVIPQL